MPMIPMPRARFSGVVTSAMYAWATAMLAVAMPLHGARANSSASVGARPSAAMPTAEAAMLHSSTGRRPTRSESRPHSGMNRNCISENTAPGSGRDEIAGAEVARQPGQERDHQPEPEQVEEDGQEQRAERRVSHDARAARRIRRSWCRRAGDGAADRDRERVATTAPAGALLGGARELVAPVDDADGDAGAGAGERGKAAARRRASSHIRSTSVET